jgi:beta-glucanase (GH16 family)
MGMFISMITVMIIVNACSDSGTGNKDDNQIPEPEGWSLIWNDEFTEGSMPDSTKWFCEYGPNWANGELQYYTDFRPENLRILNGNLVIEVRHENYGGRNYTSTRLNSAKTWIYGRMDIRARLPKGNALWPAIWMMPQFSTYGGWPNSGEIDIMENWSWDQLGIYGTIHTEDYNHTIGTQKGGKISVTAPWLNFHNYTLEWEQSQMRWFVDDSLYFTFNNEGEVSKWPFNHPFRFILNIAVEGTAEGQESTWIKRTMEIDYVRVYKKDE